MSAESLGARLLAEVQEEGFDEVSGPSFPDSAPPPSSFPSRHATLTRSQLLSELRDLAKTRATNVLGLPPLDRLLETFRAPPPAPAAHAARWASPPVENASEYDDRTSPAGQDGSHDHTAPKPKPAIIQVTSHDSAAGKSNLLYLLTIFAVLPIEHNGTGQTVVWLDSDGRFSATRLHQSLSTHLSTHQTSPPTRAEKDLICAEALRHVHVFRPQSTAQLIATLASLQDYLLTLQNHFSSTRSLGLLVLDSATAFYWQDRFDAEMARLEAIGSESTVATDTPSKTAQMIAHLKRLQKIFDCGIVFTTNTSTIKSTGSTVTPPNQPAETTRMSAWSAFATLQLTISRVPVPQFAAQMELDECKRDQPNRLDAVQTGRFNVDLDRTHGETWPGHVKDATGRLDGRGRFGLRITEKGVLLEE